MLALYRPLIHFNSYLKQLCVTKCSVSVIRVEVAYMGIHLLRDLKKELTRIIHKQLQVITNAVLFKTVTSFQETMWGSRSPMVWVSACHSDNHGSFHACGCLLLLPWARNLTHIPQLTMPWSLILTYLLVHL